MRALPVARRNADASGTALARPLMGALLFGVLACGAGPTSGGSDAVESTSDSASVAALQPAPAGADEAAAVGSEEETTAPSEEEDADGRDPMLAAPSMAPITVPPSAPAPLPTTELATRRPVTAAPMDVAINDCRFEYLGEGIRCQHADSHDRVEADATDLKSCMERCLERDDCTAVTDYLWPGSSGAGCYLYLSTCNSPSFADWAEEDGGREYRRTCSPENDSGLPIDAGAPDRDAP